MKNCHDISLGQEDFHLQLYMTWQSEKDEGEKVGIPHYTF